MKASTRGGGEVYAQLLPRTDRLFLTHVDTEVEDADACFPPFDPGDWLVESRHPHGADVRYAFGFELVDYWRR